MLSLMVLFVLLFFLRKQHFVAYRNDHSQNHKLNKIICLHNFSLLPFLFPYPLKIATWDSILKYSEKKIKR